jgi:crossover junction endodeoxyribonuclease RuvC
MHTAQNVLLLEHLPVHKTQHGKAGKIRNELDLHAIRDQLVAFNVDLAIIEAVGAMPKQGVTSMFRFGYAAGQLAGLVVGLGLPVHFTTPQAWQRFHRIGGVAGAARQRALELYPHLSALLARRKDDHRCDVLLLATCGLSLTVH